MPSRSAASKKTTPSDFGSRRKAVWAAIARRVIWTTACVAICIAFDSSIGTHANAADVSKSSAPRDPSISDVDSMPLVSLGQRFVDGYKKFLAHSLPRAFALAPASGAWAWKTGDDAAQKAMSACQEFSRATCALYAVNNAVVWKPSPGADTGADETTDWQVAVTTSFRTQDFHAPTPVTVPGAAVITTGELRAKLSSSKPPVLVDVLDGIHESLPHALWMPEGGYAGETRPAFVQLISRITGGDKSREIVVFCMSSYCWLSYNAALRIRGIGYSHIHWYRGGIAAWKVTGGPLAKPERAVDDSDAKAFGSIVVVDRQGREHALSEFRGKAVLVNFWGRWCPPCRHEMPALLRLKERLRDKPIEIVQLSNPSAWQDDIRWADESGFGALSYYVRRDPWSPEVKLRLWGIHTSYQDGAEYPTTFVLDRDGTLDFVRIGESEWDSEAWVSKILIAAQQP